MSRPSVDMYKIFPFHLKFIKNTYALVLTFSFVLAQPVKSETSRKLFL